ncbi:hypothetical protein PHYSODRAFT_361854 [Phytophthora sojae]|uniref:Uncharacterized protein n=1 Tax=Phytophthora sojae (strain P6497) TaxID=1094619 RepID=G5A513_PHYSP|nr:hypothetical protein PHYSODRAFT_361854 [Phytophthora sojae]EGZ09762.1 hypothetical protein PHYSODRAFT_361854 [Phytophthora sojae]|eukprot:XP_009534623.1 hypothetical protein PHYSODRAFT_361854 [Phytophthora sojae]
MYLGLEEESSRCVLGRQYERQEEEIVALRALAKSLKEEVKTIQKRQQLQSSACCDDKASVGGRQRIGSHEYFKLDVQIEKLEEENAELHRQLQDSQDELQRARAYIADKLPVYKLAAVKANAELRCVKSQLQQERKQSDRLQRQLVKCKARQDDVLARVGPERGNHQEEHEDDGELQESEAVRREREAFFRQCMRQQPGCFSPGNKSGIQSDVGDIIEARNTQLAGSKTVVKTDKLIHEDLMDLDFDLDEMNLSPTKSSKSI